MQKFSFKFTALFNSESASGLLMLAYLVFSLVIANSPLSSSFQDILDIQVGYSIQSWINDGLMTIFFLMVGLEIKREIINGELSTFKKAFLPIFCALGGAITPAIIYFILNRNETTANGWGIPMATDIAFALAIIGLLSKKVPASLRIFLAALAIADDLLAILVIAIFYAGNLHTSYLLYSAWILLFMLIMNRLKVEKLLFYIIPGIALWYFIHHSGVHATIAGVLTAMFVPIKSASKISPLEKLEHLLAKPVNFLIVPLFVIVNTNITLQREMIHGLTSPLGLGIILGLLIGKPAGVLMASFLCVKTGLGELPDKANWKHLIGVGLLAGIGFTMSIFMSLLSFNDALQIAEAKFSVLCGSLISAICGYLVLNRKAKSKN